MTRTFAGGVLSHKLGIEQLPQHINNGRRKLKSTIFFSHTRKRQGLTALETECVQAFLRDVPIILEEEICRAKSVKTDFFVKWSTVLDSTISLLREDPDILGYINKSADPTAAITAVDVELCMLKSTGKASKSVDSDTTLACLTEELSSFLLTDSERTHVSPQIRQTPRIPSLETSYSSKSMILNVSKESQWLPLAESLTIISSLSRSVLKGFLSTSFEVLKFRHSIQKFRRATEGIIGEKSISSEFVESVFNFLDTLDGILGNDIRDCLTSFAFNFANLFDIESVRHVFETSALCMGHLAVAANVSSDTNVDIQTFIHGEIEVIANELWSIGADVICHLCHDTIGNFTMRCCDAKVCECKNLATTLDLGRHHMFGYIFEWFRDLLMSNMSQHSVQVSSAGLHRVRISRLSMRLITVTQIAARIARAGLVQAQLSKVHDYQPRLRARLSMAPPERLVRLKSYFAGTFTSTSLIFQDDVSNNLVASVLGKVLH